MGKRNQELKRSKVGDLFNRIKTSILTLIRSPNFNTYFQTFLNILALLVAVYAVQIARKTLNETSKQFQQNMISSDSLFNLQLNHSKILNDSLIYQITELQKITNNQLKITENQLRISIQTLQEEIYSGRPKIVIQGISIADTNMVINEKIFSPLIKTQYENIGRRPAIDFVYRTFILYPDFSNARLGEKQSKNFVDPGRGSSVLNFTPKIPIAYKDDFYYCIEISYYDKELERKFHQAYYYHYYRSREGYDFFYCELEEANKIRGALNKILKRNNIELFDNN